MQEMDIDIQQVSHAKSKKDIEKLFKGSNKKDFQNFKAINETITDLLTNTKDLAFNGPTKSEQEVENLGLYTLEAKGTKNEVIKSAKNTWEALFKKEKDMKVFNQRLDKMNRTDIYMRSSTLQYAFSTNILFNKLLILQELVNAESFITQYLTPTGVGFSLIDEETVGALRVKVMKPIWENFDFEVRNVVLESNKLFLTDGNPVSLYAVDTQQHRYIPALLRPETILTSEEWLCVYLDKKRYFVFAIYNESVRSHVIFPAAELSSYVTQDFKLKPEILHEKHYMNNATFGKVFQLSDAPQEIVMKRRDRGIDLYLKVPMTTFFQQDVLVQAGAVWSAHVSFNTQTALEYLSKNTPVISPILLRQQFINLKKLKTYITFLGIDGSVPMDKTDALLREYEKLSPAIRAAASCETKIVSIAIKTSSVFAEEIKSIASYKRLANKLAELANKMKIFKDHQYLLDNIRSLIRKVADEYPFINWANTTQVLAFIQENLNTVTNAYNYLAYRYTPSLESSRIDTKFQFVEFKSFLTGLSSVITDSIRSSRESSYINEDVNIIANKLVTLKNKKEKERRVLDTSDQRRTLTIALEATLDFLKSAARIAPEAHRAYTYDLVHGLETTVGKYKMATDAEFFRQAKIDKLDKLVVGQMYNENRNPLFEVNNSIIEGNNLTESF